MGSRTIALLSSLIAGCVASGSSDERVSEQQWPVVYGQDDRVESYEVADARLANLARHNVLAIMTAAPLSIGASRVGINAPNLGEMANLCQGERFAEQPAAAVCSGVLVDAQTVLTADHCVRGLACDQMRFVRGYFYTSAGVLNPIQPRDVYRCKSVLAHALSPTADTERVDYAWLELDRPVTGPRESIEFRPASMPLEVGEPLSLVGFPSGVPLKVDSGGKVTDARDATHDYFISTSDSFHGNSGSPVFDAEDRLVGIQGRGDADYVPASEGCNVVDQTADDPASAREQATYSARATEGLCDAQPDSELCCRIQGMCSAKPPMAAGCSVAVIHARAGQAGTSGLAFLLSLLIFRVNGRRRRSMRQRLGLRREPYREQMVPPNSEPGSFAYPPRPTKM